MLPRSIAVLRLINRISLLHRVQVQTQLADTGIWGSQIPLLRYIEQHPGCTQRDIAEHLGVSDPTIATSIKRLQKAGMLEKAADEEDLRRNHITLTGRGRQTVARGRACYDQVVERMLHGVSQEEQEALAGLLTRLEENLAGEEYQGKTIFSLAAAANKLEQKTNEEAGTP